MTLVPDLAAPIAGWRIWNVIDRGRGPELLSPVRPVPWIHRVPTTATCTAGCAPCPSRACRCGLYATAGLTRPAPLHRGGAVVLGCTALWGRVVEHTDGWRAEHAYPLVLFVMSAPLVGTTVRLRRLRRVTLIPDDAPFRVDDLVGTEALARELARLYGVPAHPAPSLLGERLRYGSLAGSEAAAAVCAEAADGLADRRLGDRAAHDRLRWRALELVDPTGG